MRDIISYVCSCLGIIPTVISFYKGKIVVGFFTALATIFALLYSSVINKENEITLQNGFAAANISTGIILTIVCAFCIDMQKTWIGKFRMLWLITLVSSSSTYTYLATLSRQDKLPNDLSIIAVFVSAIILLLSLFCSVCKKNKKEDEEIEFSYINLAVESSLISGAFVLRFNNDIYEYTGFNIGFDVWHCCCWVSIFLCSIK